MSDYPRCATCKWWEPFGTLEGDNLSGTCTLISTHYSTTERKAWITGDETTAWVSVDTVADFGCVQHEPRDEQEPAQ